MIRNVTAKILGVGLKGQKYLFLFKKHKFLPVLTTRFYHHSSRMASSFTGSDHAKGYAQYRPSYPEDVVHEIITYCRESGGQFGFAVDVACGSGQCTVPLSKHFKKILGIDVSKAQIENAPKVDNVEFRVGPGEDLQALDAGTVDLITCAQGAHWLDRPKFFEEARRVLRERGVLCFYGYGIAKLDVEEASDVIAKYFTEDLKDYFEPGRKDVDNMYANIHLPFNDYHRLNDKHCIVRKMPLDGLVGYVASASGYQILLKSQPDTKLLQNFKSRIEEIYVKAKGVKREEIEVTVTWPVYMLLGRK